MPTWRDVVAIARAESDGGVVLLCTLDEKARLLASGDAAYYTTPHYDGYGSILVNLSEITPAALRDRVVAGWRLKAPRRLVAAFDEAGADKPGP